MSLKRTALVLLIISTCGNLRGQELTGLGMLATGTVSRSRVGGNSFCLGDMVYVTAIQAAATNGMYVSVHMQLWNDSSQSFVDVPTVPGPLGASYTGNKGLRDYVKFEPVTERTNRHVCLFIPYEAARLPVGTNFKMRYVIRLWDGNNNEIVNQAKELPPDSIRTEANEGKLKLTLIKVETCKSMIADNGEPLVPVAESQETGTVRMFSTSSGNWVCREAQQ